MCSRLVIACVFGVTVLSGCKHHASLDRNAEPSASVSASHAGTTSRINPLQALDNLITSQTRYQTTVSHEQVTDDAEPPIQYVEPVSLYAQSSKDSDNAVDDTHIPVDARETLPPYELDTGDRIRVFVYGQPNLTRVYSVNDQGYVSMPLVGAVLARGRTTRTLEGVIKRGLEKEFVKDAEVSIEVAVYRPFFIRGEVRTPGQYAYVYGMTVEMAVAMAGGFTPRAKKHAIKVTRKIDGNRDMVDVIDDDYVRPGDTIIVDERYF